MGLDGFGAGPWMMDFGPDTHFYQAEAQWNFCFMGGSTVVIGKNSPKRRVLVSRNLFTFLVSLFGNNLSMGALFN